MATWQLVTTNLVVPSSYTAQLLTGYYSQEVSRDTQKVSTRSPCKSDKCLRMTVWLHSVWYRVPLDVSSDRWMKHSSRRFQCLEVEQTVTEYKSPSGSHWVEITLRIHCRLRNSTAKVHQRDRSRSSQSRSVKNFFSPDSYSNSFRTHSLTDFCP